jgi:hypothetical protein
MKRNRYRLVRRSNKWVVRARYLASTPDLEWMDQTNAYKIMVDPQDYDCDFWFHTKGEAVMFMLKCN